MSIFYEGSLLGSAPVQAGSQPPRSCQLLRLPARLKASQLAQHVKRVFADVAKREMVLDAAVDIAGKYYQASTLCISNEILCPSERSGRAVDDEVTGEDDIKAEEVEE
ncbi:hypothetical protein TSUD_273580 [Trifolium subterraneum]|uniref:Uncharacterized protein n=1 Tax=Trifolium subterraneum TaxID=3900 RepID=A0A2Z6MCY9_TRISU|nr:hypothetical protein TSUD_273580 [Trifolium subterraneum]